MRRFPVCGSVVVSLVLANLASAQAPAGPPPYLQIFREQVKYGHGAAHMLSESAWPRAFAKAKIKNNYIALVSTYGPLEAWFVEGHGSLAELDAVNKAISAAGLGAELDRYQEADAAHVTNGDGILARYVPEASNAEAVNVGEIKVWEVTIFRVRPGKEASFFEGANLFKSVVQQAKASASWASFEVQAGMPGPTYLVFSPHKTLAELDQNTGTGAAIAKAMTEDMMKKLGTVSENFISVQTLVFNVSPEMSYPMAEWVTADPAFWNKKAMAPAKPAAPAPKP